MHGYARGAYANLTPNAAQYEFPPTAPCRLFALPDPEQSFNLCGRYATVRA